ncbi:Peptidase T [Entamoeba marina]
MSLPRKPTDCEERPGHQCVASIGGNGIISCKYCGIVLGKEKLSVTEVISENESPKYLSSTRLLLQYFKQLNVDKTQIKHGKQFYQELQSIYSKKYKGKKKDNFVLGVVYYILHVDGLDLTIKDIAQQLGKDEKDITKGYKLLERIIKENTNKSCGFESVDELLTKYCTTLQFNHLIPQTLSISKHVQRLLEGKKPLTIAVVIIFFVCRYNQLLDSPTKKKIASICKVTIANITSCWCPKFLRYVKVNTQSNPDSTTVPSTQCQFDLQNLLQNELTALSIPFTFDKEHCILIADLPATNDSNKSIGFFVHVDTAPDSPGENVKPLIHTLPNPVIDLELNKETVIDKNDLFPYAGEQIITASGDTLLGADDKSGVAILMATLQRIVKEKIPHPRIVAVFTPDEEIGKSCDHVDVNSLHLDYAYSIDGGEIGTYSDEGFNAFSAELNIRGHEVHPGEAYHVMEDAGLILSQFYSGLPVSKRPEHTKDNQGYILCTEMNGCVMNANAKFIVRSFDVKEMEYLKELMNSQCAVLSEQFPKSTINISFNEQYRNMKRYLPGDLLTEKLVEAMKKSNVTSKKEYMRGGADCSHLSEKGLPCINVFAGGLNFHSRREFIPVKAINKGVEVITELVQLF